MADRRVHVLINPRSGVWSLSLGLLRAFERHWEGADLIYQISTSVDDGRAKTRRAVESGADSVVVVGGDGMVNTIGSLLIGSRVSLGVVPTGSGNGFARHFGIPLEWESAVRSLATARPAVIDVGRANGRPFFVTCSMAWDASLLKAFEKMQIRGILAYVLAGASGLFEYRPQPFTAEFDDGTSEVFPDPLVFTAANLTQWGGGARIAPQARPDDGMLELVVIGRAEAGWVMAQIGALFDGTLDRLPEVRSRRFSRLRLHRERPAPIQVDGELVEAGAEVEVDVLPAALRVLVPAEGSAAPARSDAARASSGPERPPPA